MSEPLEDCDEELACSGDVEAFTRLIKHEKSMYRVARSITIKLQQ